MTSHLISRLKRLLSHERDALAAEPLHDPAWRRIVIVGTFSAMLAFVLGILFEAAAGAVSFDLVAYSLSAAGLLAAQLCILIYPHTLRVITSAIITGSGTFFVAKIAYLLFFAPPTTDITSEMTESFFWIPIMYVLAYLIPGLTWGRFSAMSINVLLLLLSVGYMLSSLGVPEWDVFLALAELNLANLTTTFVIRNFSVYKDLALKAQAKGQTMARLAHTDTLTGLPNRLHFELALQSTLTQARELGETCAVVFIDIDRFKLVNDTLGHAIGDRLLAAVAQRLRGAVRAEDLLARISGDEFVLLLRALRSPQDAEAAMQTFNALFRQPFIFDGQVVPITASIGFCLFPDDGDSGETLLKHADTAMYQVKASGRAGSRGFSAEVDAGIEFKQRLERDLRGAVAREEFTLVYQPLFNLRSGEFTKLEVLLRWQHPELGFVPPDTFIPVAEQGGLIDEISAWVLLNAMGQNVAWQRSGFRGFPLAVNISPLHFAKADFFDTIKTTLDVTGLDPRYFEIELTEGALLTHSAHVYHTLRQLQQLGVGVAIDDFGTGYSSLSYLRDLPIDIVKIDQSFISDLGRPLDTPHFALALVQAIVSIAQTLDFEVVAEGIETAAQAEMLKGLGVLIGQGYYFTKPLSEIEVQSYLPRRHAREISATRIRLLN